MTRKSTQAVEPSWWAEAIARSRRPSLCRAGCETTLAYRKDEFSRPKPENVELLQALLTTAQTDENHHVDSSEACDTGRLIVHMATEVTAIVSEWVHVRRADGVEQRIENDVVFPMLGREAPLDFFRRSGIRINGEWRIGIVSTLILALMFFSFIYLWKKSGGWLPVAESWQKAGYFPYGLDVKWAEWFSDPTTLWVRFESASRHPVLVQPSLHCSDRNLWLSTGQGVRHPTSGSKHGPYFCFRHSPSFCCHTSFCPTLVSTGRSAVAGQKCSR